MIITDNGELKIDSTNFKGTNFTYHHAQNIEEEKTIDYLAYKVINNGVCITRGSRRAYR